MGGESISETLERKKKEGWEGWKVPVLLLRDVIAKHVEQERDHIVFVVENKENGKKRPDEGRLVILGVTMDQEVRNSHLKLPSNPHPIPTDPPGEIDQFPPW